MQTIYLALGANVGDTAANLDHAIALLKPAVHDITVARLYRSSAVGYTDQPDFLNTVLRGETELDPQELLTFVKEVERQVGRIARFRWGPREIDIDIIFYGDTTLDTDNLTIPHPRFAERDFVLRPLVDISPALIDPRSHKSVERLLSELTPDQRSNLQPVLT